MILYTADELPEKIQLALQNKNKLTGHLIFSFKTLLKPNETIPTLWFALLSDGIIFLNTHKTRGVYKEFEIKEINCLRLRKLSSENIIIDIVKNNVSEKDFSFTITKDIDFNTLKKLLEKNNLSVHH